jgi:hypothetical protein
MRPMAWIAALATASAACSQPPRYLGAPLPAACTRGEVERCGGWLAERDLAASQLGVYEDPALRGYVQGIADRLAGGALIARAPRVVIGDHDGTYVAFGERIVIGRMAIERLGSEAELAAIVAHELAHVEGQHAALAATSTDPDDTWLAARRDAEGVADERAVVLLERAGYAPTAMVRALEAALEIDDDEHPPRAERLAHAARLAAGRSHGFHGRDELLERLDGLVVGRNTRLGVRVEDAWVIAALELAIELPPHHVARNDGDTLVLRHGRSVLTAYPIGSPWARELAAELEAAAAADTPLGPITVGVATERGSAVATPIGRLEHAVRELRPQPAPGTNVIVLVRPHGGLVIELSARTEVAVLERWLAGLRGPTPSELAAAAPPRIVLRRARRTAAVADLVIQCPDPDAALRLDDPGRVIARGEPLKCTDR